MEYKNFAQEVCGKGQSLVNAFEPGRVERIDNLPCLIDHRVAEVTAAAKARGSGNNKRKDVGVNLYLSFLKLKEAEFSCEIVLAAHLTSWILNEYDKRLSREPMTWKELQRKMEVAYNYGPDVFQNLIRGAVELGYRDWYSNILPVKKWSSTLNTARKWVRRGPKRPNLILLPSREEIVQIAK